MFWPRIVRKRDNTLECSLIIFFGIRDLLPNSSVSGRFSSRFCGITGNIVLTCSIAMEFSRRVM